MVASAILILKFGKLHQWAIKTTRKYFLKSVAVNETLFTLTLLLISKMYCFPNKPVVGDEKSGRDHN